MKQIEAYRQALAELVNEPQPLGIDRPAYQQALALLSADDESGAAQMLETRCTADEIAVLLAVIAELRRAQGLHEPMAGPLDGYATIQCEVAELAREALRENPQPMALRTEAVQVAAMGVRFLLDVCGGEPPQGMNERRSQR